MAQTNIYLPFGNQYLNNRVSPPLLTNSDNTVKKPGDIILSDNGGKVLLSYDYYGIYNTHGNLFVPRSCLGSTLGGGLLIHSIRLNDSMAALVYSSRAQKLEDKGKAQLFYAFVDFKFGKGMGRTIPGKTNVVLKTGNIIWSDICRTHDGYYLITAQNNDYLHLFKMDDNGVTQTDSIYNPIATGYPDISKIAPDEKFVDKNEYLMLQFSHSSNFIISNINKHIYFSAGDSSLPIYSNDFFTQIYFDKQNNKFISSQSKILHNYIFLRNNNFLHIPFKQGIQLRMLSPNNKFFYFENLIYYKYPYVFNNTTDRLQYSQFDILQKKYSDSIQISNDAGVFNYLSPNHKLNLITQEDPRNPIMYEIDPNKAGMNNGNFKFLKSYNRQLTLHNPDIYEYVKIKVDVRYDCNANVDLINKSDLSGGIDKFKWVITTQNGTRDTLYGFNQKVTYTKNGKYGFKVFASSPLDGGYGEWYYDTIEINIPKKPIVNFKAADTIICRYLPLEFKNFSITVNPKPGYTPIHLWTFGDGSPSSNEFEPTHTYTKPGIYTVSLFYSNGYCDSTLVKNQYIRVVDAPKPGFTTGIKQGCSPFTANFSDTVSLNVTKKEYLFSDSSKWRTVSTPKFNYTFNKPGHYWAVQKLYGYTGCVIRTDSVQFFVSKGLLPTDSLAITLASYDTLNHLHLEWDSHPAATSYSIYRSADGNSFSLLTNTSQTNATDIGLFKLPNYYKVVAVDSCGKLSSVKNIVKPQWISGERLPANEAAILTYAPDEGLGVPQNIELEWTYQHAINLTLGVPIVIGTILPYRDDNFANPGFLKKCYRVSALHDGKKMYSNYECLNFEPQTFIPNSFTPNGDGLNDRFLPSMMGIVSYDMKIFSRWGQLVYSGSSPWNGTIDEKQADGEVYMYTLQITRNDRTNEFHRGMVHLLR